MGKYTTTRAFQRDRERNRTDPTSDSFSSSVPYFLDTPNSESQFRVQSFLYGFDPTGLYRGYIDQRDLANYWNDYFKNTGLTWEDVKYPSLMRGYGSVGTYSRSVFSFSKNIARLYL